MKSPEQIYQETCDFFGANNGFPTFTEERVSKAIEIALSGLNNKPESSVDVTLNETGMQRQ